MEWLIALVIALIFVIGENMDLGELIDIILRLF